MKTIKRLREYFKERELKEPENLYDRIDSIYKILLAIELHDMYKNNDEKYNIKIFINDIKKLLIDMKDHAIDTEEYNFMEGNTL